MSRKPRRRAHRICDHDYDRSADLPRCDLHSPWEGWDDDRVVVLDDDDEPSTGLQFWLEQRPPHYGGDV